MSMKERIQTWREANGLSYEKAARRIGCSTSALRSWEVNDQEPANDVMKARVDRVISAWERVNADG